VTALASITAAATITTVASGDDATPEPFSIPAMAAATTIAAASSITTISACGRLGENSDLSIYSTQRQLRQLAHSTVSPTCSIHSVLSILAWTAIHRLEIFLFTQTKTK
jgi:hypothetical protein